MRSSRYTKAPDGKKNRKINPCDSTKNKLCHTERVDWIHLAVKKIDVVMVLNNAAEISTDKTTEFLWSSENRS